ncbi:septal ring lytic transglycosylase RlpA family protein [Cytophaga hutchinsonii]|uniref:Probable endolytic peptidoglycan transglycosylase RlpA n=1 Tax=Cytophaga hutchinsonii (strain ATCC 33406 / DSM 1761 / CIP 103989 / NBRC 15051 / NCIMB 9469 / D465) TaxID=269798 RepID=A0A6N4SSX8_CYTH3|nr:septal ring lytic transglycosylase RlpA family protein [Cytophaga hutchinsonii]ABG59484.1 rare lipoprotein A-like protein [Cytophaga hutchinsonii ATCC 33406]SFX96887.1 rare lipoprotein A [Cytophaga hutchinsonii ATCC 33406]
MQRIRIFVSLVKNLIIKNIHSKFGFIFVLLFCLNYTLFSKSEPTTGSASYYANKFQGKRTASGETYDKNKFTAAHRTYAFGTKLKVTNIKTGIWIQVYVNDRGPYAKDRIIDVSYAAATALGMIQPGTIQVKLEILSDGDVIEIPPPVVHNQKPNSLSPGFYSTKLEPIQRPKGYLLQIGAFSSYEHASRRIGELDDYTIGAPCIELITVKKKKLYRVIYSGFATKQKVTQKQKELKKKGFDSVILSPK